MQLKTYVICLKAAKPLQKNRLLLITKFPGISGTHTIELKSMKG